MIFNNSVTLYHKSGDNYEKHYFVRACVFNDSKIETGNGSHVLNNSLTIRIFTLTSPGISPGDRLVLGYSEELSPPENSYIILGVTENCRGSKKTRHYKIKCR